MDWGSARAPSLETIETLGEAAFAALPENFRLLCRDVVIQVVDFPDDDVVAAMECESEFDLLGLFCGRGLSEGEHLSETFAMPNMVFLYRRAILDYWAENDETLADIVRHVLVHEIGHHFGLSDADMERIENSAP